MASFVVGIGVLLTWEYVPGSDVLHEVFPALILSTATYVGLSLVTQDGADEQVAAMLRDASGPAEAAER
jgi:Na+/proline symporter